jgi:hypothetical protein
MGRAKGALNHDFHGHVTAMSKTLSNRADRQFIIADSGLR